MHFRKKDSILKISFRVGLPQWVISQESTCNAGEADLIPVLGTSSGKGNGNHFSILA